MICHRLCSNSHHDVMKCRNGGKGDKQVLFFNGEPRSRECSPRWSPVVHTEHRNTGSAISTLKRDPYRRGESFCVASPYDSHRDMRTFFPVLPCAQLHLDNPCASTLAPREPPPQSYHLQEWTLVSGSKALPFPEPSPLPSTLLSLIPAVNL